MRLNEWKQEARDLSRDIRRSPGLGLSYLIGFLVVLAGGMWMTGFFGELGREAAAGDGKEETHEVSSVAPIAPNDRALLELALAPGRWRPTQFAGWPAGTLDPAAMYPERQAYSRTDLTALGALQPTSEGLYALYTILANLRNDRPRLAESWPIGYSNGAVPFWAGLDLDAEMEKDLDLRARLERLQAYLREHQEQLVEDGKLHP